MSLIEDLQLRGVVVHAPAATVIEDVDPLRFEAGAEIFPGCTIRGARTLVGRGTLLGKAGGGYFENVSVGRNADLFSGYFVDATFLDGVTVRGHAEMRGGTLMEEGAECGHHVGYKMTIMMPNVVAGSLVNFCDALMAGGTSRKDHSEIGSCLALYNFTPWGDKFASMFGDVPHGVFLRERRIFVGGQTQIVSPVKVGYGALIPAGAAVRRSVPSGRLYGELPVAFDMAFDPDKYGGLSAKFDVTAEFVGNLHALAAWYRHVRLPFAAGDSFEVQLYESALRQIHAGIAERIKRLDTLVTRLPASLEKHEQERARTGAPGAARRIVEHHTLIDDWPGRAAMLRTPGHTDFAGLNLARDALVQSRERGLDYIDAVTALDAPVIDSARATLQAIVDSVVRG